MAIQVSLTADGVGVVYTSSGTLTSRDLFEADARLRSELVRNPGLRYLLVDHGAIPDESIDTDSLGQLAGNAGMALELIPEALVAIVAPSDVLYGISRMWEMTATHPRMRTHAAAQAAGSVVRRTRPGPAANVRSETG